ncbi:hypothetical protein pEaSNUABM29_00170 [Erwinia phage pEa_SNUABM_29]|nr:hypothetical protein pEaSNUABM29_00170 [Erwinia phage pEa_SNUABM_29]
MMNYERKIVWQNHLRSGVVKNDQQVKMWVLPHGVICEMVTVSGMPILRNGKYDSMNTVLARLLADAGIMGTVILFSTATIPQNLSRWLTHWLSNEPTEDDSRLRSITVTTMGQLPTKPLPFQVNVIEPALLKAGDVFEAIKQKSRDRGISQFLIEAGDTTYRLEPVRRMDATVIDCTEYGYVLRTQADQTFLASMLSRRVQAQLAHYGVRPADLIGTTVKVEYTMYTEGNRLCNFKSPVVYRSIALDSMGESTVPSYDGPYPFKSQASVSRALLTVTRCKRAAIKRVDGEIYGEDGESDAKLFSFRQGVKPGMYAATFEKGGAIENWHFESDFAVDAIDPDALVTCISDQIFYATGMSLQRIGLHYANSTSQSVET